MAEMKWIAWPCFLAPFLFIAGCASAHRADGAADGFTETRPAPDVFRIGYPKDGITHSERTQDLALLRASELALQNGLPHFSVLEDEGPLASRHTSEASKPPALPWSTTGLTVLGYRTKPSGFFTFDAAFLLKALRKKYGILPTVTPGPKAARPSLESLRRFFTDLPNGQRLRLAMPHVAPNEGIFMGYYPEDDTIAMRPVRGGPLSGRIYLLQEILSVEEIDPEPQNP
jgi:hypothetical protein